jgi:peptidoglycan/xylan/chitin deacetylase (PgdA/CDA1 family)
MRHLLHSRMTRRDIEADTRRGLAVLAGLGIRPLRWRPPGGISTRWTTEVAERSGLTLTGWSADPQDWCSDPAAIMLARLDAWLRPGSVVVMHDAIGPGARREGCGETVRLVDSLVVAIRSLGAEPAPLPAPLDEESEGVRAPLPGSLL